MGFKKSKDKFKGKADANTEIQEGLQNAPIDEDVAKSVEKTKQARKDFNEKYYKNILCIDDMDDGDAEKEPMDWLKYWLAKDEDYTGIELAKTIWEAVTKIKNCNKYDFVIFDMDLNQSFDYKSTINAEEIEKIFIEHNINFSYDKIKTNSKTAGIYLYVLLLSYGYPINRMLIHSRNSIKSSLKDEVENKLSYFTFDFSNKDSNTFHEKAKNSLNLEKYFEKGSYYRVRRLVSQACDYWIKNISETAEIRFNKIYFTEKKQESQIEKDSFIDMLERIKMLFPVAKPIECEKIYYQALQIATMHHENSADITTFDKENTEESKKLKQFHAVSRNFRNFSAHNKFKDKDKTKSKNISADEFALIFCITLRTYFSDKDFSDELLDYEKKYFGEEEPPKINSNEEIIDKWQNNLLKHCDINTLGKTPENVSIEKLIIHIGHLPDNFLEPKDIILGLFNDVIQIDAKPTVINSKAVVLTYPVQYNNIRFDSTKPAEKFFTKYAYQLITAKVTNQTQK